VNFICRNNDRPNTTALSLSLGRRCACQQAWLLPAQWLWQGIYTKWGVPLCLFCSAANNTHTTVRGMKSFRTFVKRELAARRLLAVAHSTRFQKVTETFPPSRVQTGWNTQGGERERRRESALKQCPVCVRPIWESVQAVGSIVDWQARQPVSKFGRLN
jgi:hypothetical protein